MTAPENQDLAALRIPELRQIASSMGLRGISALRKGELIAAITEAGGLPVRAAVEKTTSAPAAKQEASDTHTAPAQHSSSPAESTSTVAATSHEDDTAGEAPQQEKAEHYESRSAARRARRNRARQQAREQRRQRQQANVHDEPASSAQAEESADVQQQSAQDVTPESREHRRADREEQSERYDRRNRRGNRRGNRRDGDNQRGSNDNRDNGGEDSAPADNLQPVAGILDIVDSNLAFVRTTGYHPSPNDVFVNQQLVRRYGLRTGDAVIGLSKPGTQPVGHGGRGRNKRQQFASLSRIESVNGHDVEAARNRPEFAKLTPLYPNQRLRLETEPNILTTRVIDLIMPIGKGQRALIVSPPKAGKTTILQNLANAIAKNNPECYLMVVLIDERPEEVTDMQRSVAGEVIASTFDRPPSEHTAVAELAIERAKRLVEEGKDVVVLLDSITRLGRAYNNSSPASGRILSGGVDSNALYPPKRFLGAARNIENGGSLTIIATALVETGSAGDSVIFEEFKGTGNAELKLDRKIAERRVFPAVDVNPSGTRKDHLLLVPEEAKIMHKLRRILAALDSQQAIDLLIKQLKKTRSNGEFLMQVASSQPMAGLMEEQEYS